MQESVLTGVKNRLLQHLANWVPGSMGLRVLLHRMRGVRIGQGTWIGYEALIETAYPSLVTIGSNVTIGMRTTIIAHFQELTGVTIGNNVYVGPCAVILPGVNIGEGAVITAGSVVTTSVPAMTVVQGNPAKRIARCGMPLLVNTSRREFTRHLRKLERAPHDSASEHQKDLIDGD
jgi:acetyltransferase-like isoleucine patch superfamily enzyme